MDKNTLLEKIAKERDNIEDNLKSDEGMARLLKVYKDYAGEDKLDWSSTILEKIKNRPASPLHKTGLAALDDVVGGFREQQLITSFGHTGHGKTQWGVFTMEKLEHLNPVMLSLEQSPEELIEQRHEQGQFIPEFLTQGVKPSDVTLEWIEERIIEGIAKHGTKFVLIDHLGYIGSDKKYQKDNRSFKIGKIMQGLKNIAVRWDVIIHLLVHIKKEQETKIPELEDITDSSDIAKESSIVMSIWRKTEKINKIIIRSNDCMLSVHKNRRTGKTGNIGLKFHNEDGRYYENGQWVKQMEEMARQELEADDKFNDL